MNELRSQMQKTVDGFNESIRKIRGKTITSALIDSVKIIFWGQTTNLCSVALTRKADNGIIVEPHCEQDDKDIAKQLTEQGFNAYVYAKGKVIVSVNPPTLEEKQKIVKHLNKLAEDAKIAIRQIRRNYRDGLKPVQREEEDDSIQDITDDAIFEIDDSLKEKISSL